MEKRNLDFHSTESKRKDQKPYEGKIQKEGESPESVISCKFEIKHLNYNFRNIR